MNEGVMLIYLNAVNVALTGIECLMPLRQSLTRLFSSISLSLEVMLLLSEPL